MTEEINENEEEVSEPEDLEESSDDSEENKDEVNTQYPLPPYGTQFSEDK